MTRLTHKNTRLRIQAGCLEICTISVQTSSQGSPIQSESFFSRIIRVTQGSITPHRRELHAGTPSAEIGRLLSSKPAKRACFARSPSVKNRRRLPHDC